MINKVLQRVGWLLAAWLCCVLITGCKSTKLKTGPGADSLASVEVHGHTARKSPVPCRKRSRRRAMKPSRCRRTTI